MCVSQPLTGQSKAPVGTVRRRKVKAPPHDEQIKVRPVLVSYFPPIVTQLKLKFSRDTRLLDQSHGPAAGQRGVTELQGHHVTRREDEGVSKSCRRSYFFIFNFFFFFFLHNLRRDLFSSRRTTEQAARGSVKQSGPTVSRHHGHA